MPKHNRQAAEKAARNAAYAERFPRRSRSARKQARQARVAARERAWCLDNGVDPTPTNALRAPRRGRR